jgi:hypothetical protein
MKLETLLSENRAAIQKHWLRSILETYPADSQRFLKEQKDQFLNPVRHAFSQEIEHLFEAILEDWDSERVSPILDGIIRVRAVQDFTPSEAVSFIFLLKGIIREELEEEIRKGDLFDNLSALESKIDRLALLAFDIFVKRREKIYQIRAKEAKNQVSRLLVRAGLVSEVPPWDPFKEEGENN